MQPRANVLSLLIETLKVQQHFDEIFVNTCKNLSIVKARVRSYHLNVFCILLSILLIVPSFAEGKSFSKESEKIEVSREAVSKYRKLTIGGTDKGLFLIAAVLANQEWIFLREYKSELVPDRFQSLNLTGLKEPPLGRSPPSKPFCA